MTTAFTPEQDERIMSMLANKKSIRRIADLLGVNRNNVSARIMEMRNTLALGTTTPSPAQLPAMRLCLCCRRQFKSEHAGNRMCSSCLQRDRESGLPASIQQASV